MGKQDGAEAKDGKGAKDAAYAEALEALQVEMLKLQRDVGQKGRRVAILFEGRDAAGKGGAITRFTEHLNPRSAKVVALPKPTPVERGQWYFQRYVGELPNPGELRFFDRSWYNRAVIEPVMGFCTEAEYRVFMGQVNEFERMLVEDGIELLKFWFSISKAEQAQRFEDRRKDPLKQWKLSPVDEKAQEKWDEITKYKNAMLQETHTKKSPWVVVRGNKKKRARLESMRYVLGALAYEGKGKKDSAGNELSPDPGVVCVYDAKAEWDD
jgi:polyphosphate kinase 2